MVRTKGALNKNPKPTYKSYLGDINEVTGEPKRIFTESQLIANYRRIKKFRKTQSELKAVRRDSGSDEIAVLRESSDIIPRESPESMRGFFQSMLNTTLSPTLSPVKLRSLYVGAKQLWDEFQHNKLGSKKQYKEAYFSAIRNCFDHLNKGSVRRGIEVLVMTRLRSMYQVDNLLELQDSSETNSVTNRSIDAMSSLSREKSFARGLMPSRGSLQRARDETILAMKDVVRAVLCNDGLICKLDMNDVIDEVLENCEMLHHGRNQIEIESGNLPVYEIMWILGADGSHLGKNKSFAVSCLRIGNSDILNCLFRLWSRKQAGLNGDSLPEDLAEETVLGEVVGPEQQTWKHIHSVFACIILAFVQGKDNLENMEVMLKDIFSEVALWGTQKELYYSRRHELFFNFKALVVNDMAQQWVVAQCGGGSHSTEYFDANTWKTGPMRGQPSPYRCSDICLPLDELDPEHKKFECRHVKIVTSEDIILVRANMGNFPDDDPIMPHWIAYGLRFPLKMEHVKLDRVNFSKRYLQETADSLRSVNLTSCQMGRNQYTKTVSFQQLQSYDFYPEIGTPMTSCRPNWASNIECMDDICPVGSMACINRVIQTGNNEWSSKFELCSHGSRGQGIKVKKVIERSEFIQEYTGIVLSEAEARQVLIPRLKKSGTRVTSYLIKLGTREFKKRAQIVYIDAAKTTSMCRFINHSCSPNCDAESWLVMGLPRIGIFANRQIGIGEYLSFDYGWEATEGWPQQPCLCGSSNCSGFLQK